MQLTTHHTQHRTTPHRHTGRETIPVPAGLNRPHLSSSFRKRRGLGLGYYQYPSDATKAFFRPMTAVQAGASFTARRLPVSLPVCRSARRALSASLLPFLPCER